jgi:hypothetical protein
VCEFEVTFDRVLNDLIVANGDKARLAAELSDRGRNLFIFLSYPNRGG